jgi:hypothetical protein
MTEEEKRERETLDPFMKEREACIKFIKSEAARFYEARHFATAAALNAVAEDIRAELHRK